MNRHTTIRRPHGFAFGCQQTALVVVTVQNRLDVRGILLVVSNLSGIDTIAALDHQPLRQSLHVGLASFP